RAGGTGDGTTDEHDAFVGQDAGDLDVLQRLGVAAHLATHALAREHATGGEAATDRTTVTEVLVHTVASGLAAHAVALHHALESFTLRDALHVDLAAFGEHVERELRSDRVLLEEVGGDAEFLNFAAGGDSRGLELAELGLAHPRGLLLVEADLQRGVAVSLDRA